jgi:hypothetical protein
MEGYTEVFITPKALVVMNLRLDPYTNTIRLIHMRRLCIMQRYDRNFIAPRDIRRYILRMQDKR